MLGKIQINSKGFTLIESMIVISIVAVLIALAIPAHQDDFVRAKVTECIHGAASPKIANSEYRQATSEWPPNENSATISGSARQSKHCNGLSNIKKKGLSNIDVDEISAGALPVGTKTSIAGPSLLTKK